MQTARKNHQIRVPELRVIDTGGKQLGIMKTSEALAIAYEQGLDLVEVSPQAKPPVARLIDFNKLKYHQRKLEQQQKKKAKKIEVKGIRLSLRISEHDLGTKAKQAEKFLSEGNKIKVDLMMRGREQAFSEMAQEVIKKFLNMLPPHEIESPPKKTGNILSTVVKNQGTASK